MVVGGLIVLIKKRIGASDSIIENTRDHLFAKKALQVFIILLSGSEQFHEISLREPKSHSHIAIGG
jgi:hypothetical protein